MFWYTLHLFGNVLILHYFQLNKFFCLAKFKILILSTTEKLNITDNFFDKLNALFFVQELVLNYHQRPGVSIPRAYNSTAAQAHLTSHTSNELLINYKILSFHGASCHSYISATQCRKPLIFKLWIVLHQWSLFEVSKVFTIGLQRYRERESKIWVCGKNSIPCKGSYFFSYELLTLKQTMKKLFRILCVSLGWLLKRLLLFNNIFKKKLVKRLKEFFRSDI